MVPPEMINTNRAKLASLATTNCLAQTSAMIADTDAEYEKMWADDADAITTPAPSTAPISVEGLAPASPETGGPETCWAACRWPAARASARPTPVFDTGFAPP